MRTKSLSLLPAANRTSLPRSKEPGLGDVQHAQISGGCRAKDALKGTVRRAATISRGHTSCSAVLCRSSPKIASAVRAGSPFLVPSQIHRSTRSATRNSNLFRPDVSRSSGIMGVGVKSYTASQGGLGIVYICLRICRPQLQIAIVCGLRELRVIRAWG